MPTSENQAISSAIVVVESLISVSRPPMIPPRPIGVSFASQMKRSLGRERAILAVERGEVLAVGGESDPEASAAERVEVVGVVRLVQLQHHVVADVDDVADRTHAGRGEATSHPLRRRLDLDAGDHGRGESSAAITVDDLDAGDPFVAGHDE